MTLVRALNAGISGLLAFQVRVDVIGDNLANVDTTGFKTARAEFQNLLSQNLGQGSGPSGSLGGVNPVQIGLGTSVKSTPKNFSQGDLKATGLPSDLAIEGDGFFILHDAGGADVYSRDGAFALNSTNFLVDPSKGFFVQGFQADFTTFAIAAGGTPTNLEIPVGDLRIARETDNAFFDGNLNGAGAIAGSGTVLESETFLQLAGAPGARVPVAGAERAGLGTLLIELGRQSVGAAFTDFQLSDGTIDANGDGLIDPASVIEVQVGKGNRLLPTKRFQVAPTSGSPPPPGIDDAGATLRDFIDFLENILGINNGLSAVSDETYGGFIAGGAVVATAGVPVSSVSFADAGGLVAAQLEVDDYIRFTSGAGAGQIGQLTAPPVTVAGVTTLTFTALDPTRPAPVAGDFFELNEAARVTVGTGAPPLGDPFPGLDPTAPVPAEATPAAKEDLHSAGGRIRIAGNAGLANAITNLQISVNNQRLSVFQQLKQATGESVISNATFFDSLGGGHPVEVTYVLQSKSDLGNRFRWFAESEDNAGARRVVGTGLIEFAPDGSFRLDTPIDAVTIDLSTTGAATPLVVNLNHSRVTGFASQPSEVAVVDQDGFEEGTLRDFSVNADGIIKGIFTNGQVRDLGQLAMARFANNNGLISAGDNIFRVGVNSGLPLVGTPGSFGRGIIRGGFLENSNVDISEQFTDLIISQRAFQANARTISVANEMLQDLVNLV